MATHGFRTSARLILLGTVAVLGTGIAPGCGGEVDSGDGKTDLAGDGGVPDSRADQVAESTPIESGAEVSPQDSSLDHHGSSETEPDSPWNPEAAAGDVGDAVDVSDAVDASEVCVTASCAPMLCLGMKLECGDCIDNDGDGLFDMADPECTSPCDNTEADFGRPVPGYDPGACHQRCYYDVAPLCLWDHSCDALVPSPACQYNPSPKCQGLQNSQSPECLSTCLPASPNGCDCFGCCELPAHSGQYVFLGSRSDADLFSCTLSDVLDPTRCHPCTPVPSCLNPCDACEVCIGGQVLDPGCSGIQACAAGAQRCGMPCDPACPEGSFCQTGCCVPAP